ncbi:hypothetical protein HPB48_022677 [Haemaphysalis longicornis]|uniref:Uncharacterized protein n=1 Tax=Haemaphysalis longicornis TaxID=44386 RepID=A0A9J6FUU6_HAELO|nr:hypothetical protein HPB48_022677 [Haemaphysalis longicornis]
MCVTRAVFPAPLVLSSKMERAGRVANVATILQSFATFSGQPGVARSPYAHQRHGLVNTPADHTYCFQWRCQCQQVSTKAAHLGASSSFRILCCRHGSAGHRNGRCATPPTSPPSRRRYTHPSGRTPGSQGETGPNPSDTAREAEGPAEGFAVPDAHKLAAGSDFRRAGPGVRGVPPLQEKNEEQPSHMSPAPTTITPFMSVPPWGV